jgi:Putative Ig domain
MPDQIPVPDASEPAQVSPGQRSRWWAVAEDTGGLLCTVVGAIKVPAILLIGIAFIEVSCSSANNILTNLFPTQSNQYTIFELWTVIFAGIFAVSLLVVAWVHDENAPDRSTNYLVVFSGMSLGWLLGIVLEPFTSGEAGKFVTYAGVISAFFTGYGAGKLDDLVKYIFNPQNLTKRRKFHGALLLVSFVIALIVVYQARFAVYQELSITTTSPLPDAMANKDYVPTRIEANGGTPPLKWDIAPALPAGLSLDRNIGVISGTPKGVSPSTKYRITVTDSANPPISSFKDLSLEVKQ